MTVILLIVASVIIAIVLCGVRKAGANSAQVDSIHSVPVTNPYDTKRLRRELLASAKDEQELEYLKELDALDLYRRHLIC